ncbi:MAG: phenylalanine--tRNA ligase subunit beta [Actinomycetota bacterium]|nr:phenylalanine--tRNA ligase subunit beta [Actinomycetota bacterium]
MRVSLEWLSDYINLEVDVDELAELLTDSGTEVEGIERMGLNSEGLSVGWVAKVRPHPNADRLSLCEVDVGGSLFEVVCGAPNLEAGIAAPFAPPGSFLPDGTHIKEVDIRGVTSQGMLLSGIELGITGDTEGLLLLDLPERENADLEEALGLPDTVLVLEITPNRPDCLSVIGMAREIAALTGCELRMPPVELRESREDASGVVEIEIWDTDLCSRYTARIIDALEIKGSPWWIRRRLQACGVRPISNVVDITNYVMLELGQPLHAFDYDMVSDHHIIVRRADEGDTLTTLDGVKRDLGPENLLICDTSGPIALAGVMGGERTEVGDGTRKVLLESAHFDAANIMRTSRSHELSSEASYRFERGVDPNGCVYAADRASFLIQKLAAGKVLGRAMDVVGRAVEPVALEFRVHRAGRLIGVALDSGKAGDLLGSIQLDVQGVREEKAEEILNVRVPTFRPDLEREIDLVEEIARLYGYRNIPPTLPKTSHNMGGLTREQSIRRSIKRVMNGLGLYEAVTYSFISPRWLDVLDPDGEVFPRDIYKLRNPISEEMSAMRLTLLPGLLEVLRFNLNRRNLDVFVFEMGRVFEPLRDDKLPHESISLAAAMMGLWSPKQWSEESEKVDFFTMKGVLEGLFSSLHASEFSLSRERFPFLHPAWSCRLEAGGEDCGYLGLIHPRVAEAVELPPETALMEIGLESLLNAAPELLAYEEIPRFPAAVMDIAVVVREEVDEGEVLCLIKDAGGDLLREARLFDLYRGEQVGEGEKSLAYSLTFYALDRTLKDEEAKASYDNIVEKLSGTLGARIRS